MMRDWTKRGVAAVIASVLAVAAQAQTMSVSPSTVLQGGSTATINYSNPSRAGESIEIRVSGGYPSSSEYVSITLDGNGEGSGTWVVNTQWGGCAFNAPDVNEIARSIQR